MKHFILIFISLIVLCIKINAQVRYGDLHNRLSLIDSTSPGLNSRVQLSVNEVQISDFLITLAKAYKLNITISNEINISVSNNFYSATVKDVLIYLCQQYNLDFHLTGDIINFTRYIQPKNVLPVKQKVKYNDTTRLVTIDFKADSIYSVVKEISNITGENVILAPGTENRVINAFIQNRPLASALKNMAYANGLELAVSQDSFYIIKSIENDVKSNKISTKEVRESRAIVKGLTNDGHYINIERGKITMQAHDFDIGEVIEYCSERLKIKFLIYQRPQGTISAYIENASYDEFLNFLLHGTDFTFLKEGEFYLIGSKQSDILRGTKLFQLQNRTVEKVIEIVPSEIKKSLELKEFIELNAIVATGSYSKIKELESFIREIDKVVPVILIDVLIVNVSKSATFSTGISAGIGENPQLGKETILPEFNFNISTDEINNLINGINGIGTLNLGKVSPLFYLSIKAMEQNGVLKTKSSPRLATINGHKANTTIGKTEYYLETSNNVIGSQNPQNIITQNFKSVNADLSINIRPIVSGDEQVTLEIEVIQSDFTERISPNAPPGNVSRKFNSTIRMRNEEMILLGGLEEQSTNDAGAGIPLLSRIPIIKWLFSERNKASAKSKLNIFIKPTIVF